MGAWRGGRRWLIALPPAAVLLWLVIAVTRFLTSDDPLGGGPEKVSCAEALAFAGAELPGGSRDTECTVREWLDVDYTARFRMPRKDVRDWLARTCPDAPRPQTRFCVPDTADLCLSLGFTEGGGDYAGEVPGAASPGFGANAVDVTVEYEDADTAKVLFIAFTV